MTIAGPERAEHVGAEVGLVQFGCSWCRPKLLAMPRNRTVGCDGGGVGAEGAAGGSPYIHSKAIHATVDERQRQDLRGLAAHE
jgi:hypothetical protein